jgi:predicted nucleotidyltransferase component of viral defense system
MRGLNPAQLQRLSDFHEQWEQAGTVTQSMLEKDILVREAILAIRDAGQDEGCQLVFCGGTSLSQAHQLIERMSEDADFRIVVRDGLSQGQTRKLLSAVKTEIATLLDNAGFPLVGEMRGRNNNSYIMGEFAYQSSFSNLNSAMREHLKLEITGFAPITPVSELRLATIVDRVTGTISNEENIQTVSVMDTLADKLVGYLRRTAQERAGLTRGDYDDRLVRHLYDTHCVHAKLSSSPDFDAIEFAERLSNLVSLTIERDVDTYGHQYEVFADAPYEVLHSELGRVGDDDTRIRYERFCQTMIWGETPSFDDVAGTFTSLGQIVLTGRKGEGDERLGAKSASVAMRGRHL